MFLPALFVLTAAKAERFPAGGFGLRSPSSKRMSPVPRPVGAATIVTRFGKESDTVLINVAPRRFPGCRTDTPEAEARVRALPDGGCTLRRHQIPAGKAPSRSTIPTAVGWQRSKPTTQILHKQPDMVIPEIED